MAYHAAIVALRPDFDRQIANFDMHQFPYLIEQDEQSIGPHLPCLRPLLGTAPSP